MIECPSGSKRYRVMISIGQNRMGEAVSGELRQTNELPPAFLFYASSSPMDLCDTGRKIRTFARSIGWMIMLAKVAADPPHTNGSAALANPFVSGILLDKKGREKLVLEY